MTSLAASLVPGIDMSDYSMPGLDSPDEPVALHVTGSVPSFLDDDGAALVCRLPFPPLGLKSQLAGGEGQRRLPYFLNQPQVQSATVRMELAPELAVASLPEGFFPSCTEGATNCPSPVPSRARCSFAARSRCRPSR